MKLSVIVPTFGKREYLKRLLESLKKQVDAPDFEVIIVEDGADPGMAEYVRQLGPPFAYRVFVHERTLGRAATRNRGIAASAGDVVVFLDGDMVVVPEFLAGHAAAHRTGSAGQGNTVALGNIVTAPEVGDSAFVRYIDSRGVHKVNATQAIPSRYFMTGNSSVAAPLLQKAGGFDEEFNEYGGEDTEMGYRLAREGGEFRFARPSISYHLDLNDVPKMSQRLVRYGEKMLPVLVRKVPNAGRELQLHLVEPAQASDSTKTRVLKWLVWWVARPLFYRPAAALAEALPAWVRADLLFDYVRAASYLDGYRRHLQMTGAPAASAEDSARGPR